MCVCVNVWFKGRVLRVYDDLSNYTRRPIKLTRKLKYKRAAEKQDIRYYRVTFIWKHQHNQITYKWFVAYDTLDLKPQILDEIPIEQHFMIAQIYVEDHGAA